MKLIIFSFLLFVFKNSTAQVQASEINSKDTVVFAPLFNATTLEGEQINL